MFYKVISGSICGMMPYLVTVETDVSNGIPYFNMVGMLSSEVKESRERVRAALKNCGYGIKAQKITVNLSPADIKKEGSAFDLPIALSILCAVGMIPHKCLNNVFAIGELGLDGSLHSVNGVLPILLKAEESGIKTCVIPKDNYYEATEVYGIKVIPANNLGEIITYLIEGTEPDISNQECTESSDSLYPDLENVYGQSFAKRAIEVAVAGRHNLLLIGPPGSGKSTLAKCIPGIMPCIERQEQLEISKIYSVCGLLKNGRCITERPFRAPHHTITRQGMIGGGMYPKPGEISLSHGGVLFMDELGEFNPQVLDVLRQPMVDKEVLLTRKSGNFTFKADCMIVAAMNPCKCGYYPDRTRCTCSDEEVKRYIKKVSGAMLDRIDICVEVPRIEYKEINERKHGESSDIVRKRIIRAHQIQKQRYSNRSFNDNASLQSKDIEKYCELDGECKELMQEAYNKFGLSTRGYYSVLKIARTIADLNSERNILPEHLMEAIGYRTADRRYWG